ncbi:TetR/AcrR family transcriptional regulator [Streptomyces sp. NPDC091271]|uniref:TetR/AcrR family transcriptional regulator n=1 Tax=Streptomyces sp. NPDC091271 TaxID=3365980 RepID=UPI0037F4B14F
MTPPRNTLRADAQRNREHLIATAAEAFASGKAISLDSIAKRAGVGSGTLYRHFPTREDLVEEVYRDQIRPLRDDARTFWPPSSPHRLSTPGCAASPSGRVNDAASAKPWSP